MTATQWGDAEEAALDYLPHEAQVLYLRGMRRYMDYSTGIVGVSRRISRKGLLEILEVHPEPGSTRKYKPIKEDGLRSLFKLLRRAGLIERVQGYERTTVFRLPLATLYSSASERNTRGAPEEHPSRSDLDEYCSSAGSEDMNTRGAPEEHPSRSAPHQVSGNRKEEAALVQYPRARVDELQALLLEIFSDYESQVNGPKVHEMLVEWVGLGVKDQQVREAYKAVCERDPGLGVGPSYIDGPVKDLLQGKRLNSTKPDWARVPADGNKLWEFAKKYGFSGPGRMMTDFQYRAVLVEEVEARMREGEQ